MTMDELHALATKLGAEQSDDQITLIYNIIDKESEVGSMDIPTEPKPKKRGRKSKAEKEAELAMTQEPAEDPQPKKRGRKPKAEKEAELAMTQEPAEAPQPKKRGRKPKALIAETNQLEQAENNSNDHQETKEDTVLQPDNSDTTKQGTDYNDVQAQRSDNNRIGGQPGIAEKRPSFRIIRDVRPSSLVLAEMQQKETTLAPSPAIKAEEKTYSFGNSIIVEGVLEICTDNANGFLRSSDYNYMPSPDDVHITYQQIKNYGLKTGDVVKGNVNMPSHGEKYFTMGNIISINGCDPRVIRDRSPFENLTPLFPDSKFNLCSGSKDPLSVRIVDLFAPIGKGQRALIVAQPKTGKTILMKEIANAIAKNHPEAYLMMLLIDERPEEVTDMARTVKAEVIASTFDEPAERHVRIANIVLEKAKRMVECGHDVVIFLDSITRLARAYNTVTPASGKVLTGGVDANAMHKPKRFFGAARNIEGGGSLTIIATALIDTGSKMDEVIFEEFKGTGNMELQLDRMLANKRIFPAVNIVQSSTRRDDLLQDKMTLDRMWILRKYLADMNAIEAMTEIKEKIERTHDNEEFILSMNS